MSLNSEHQNEIHILDQRYVKSLLEAIAMNLCKSMATLGSKGQESSRNVAELTEQLAGISRVPIRFWNLSVHDRTTL